MPGRCLRQPRSADAFPLRCRTRCVGPEGRSGGNYDPRQRGSAAFAGAASERFAAEPTGTMKSHSAIISAAALLVVGCWAGFADESSPGAGGGAEPTPVILRIAETNLPLSAADTKSIVLSRLDTNSPNLSMLETNQ